MTQRDRPAAAAHVCDLGAVSLFGGLPEGSLDALAGICRRRSFSAGQTVIADHEIPSFVGCVSAGILRMQKTLPDGREHIVGLLVENDMFGRVFNGKSNFAIEAATDVELCCFDRRALEALLSRDAELERTFLINALDELDAAREWIMLLGCRRVTERLAAFLLILVRRGSNVRDVTGSGKGHITVHIPVNRADLAHYLGTRAETISRAIHSLADAGIVGLNGPYDLEIRDLDALIGASGNEDFGRLSG